MLIQSYLVYISQYEAHHRARNTSDAHVIVYSFANQLRKEFHVQENPVIESFFYIHPQQGTIQNLTIFHQCLECAESIAPTVVKHFSSTRWSTSWLVVRIVKKRARSGENLHELEVIYSCFFQYWH